MSIKLLDFRDLDVSQIEFQAPEKQRNSHFSRAKYNGDDIYIKTTKLINSNGIVKNENRAYVELEFGDNQDFYNFMCNLDETCISSIHEKSEDWFNKQFPKDIVEEFYLGPLKHKGEPKIKLKVPLSKSSIDCLIYDNVGNCTQDLGVNNSIICVLHFIGLKFLKQQVIAEWVPIQIKTSDILNVKPSNYLIEDNLDEDEELSDTLTDDELDDNQSVNDEVNEQNVSEINLENTDLQNVEENINSEDSWQNNLNEVDITGLTEEENEISEVEKELEKYKNKLRHLKTEINSILLD